MAAADAIKNPSLSKDYFLPEKEEKLNMAATAAIVKSTPESSEVAADAVDSAGLTSDTSSEGSTDAPAEESSEKDISGDQDDDIGIKLETAPIDYRFPTTNQTKHCFTRYIEYHRCIAVKGEGASECNKFARYYRSLCPDEWIENWNEQRENGTFPGPL